jgi:hypothetical protein
LRVVAENLSQLPDVERQIAFFDKTVRPDFVHQFVFAKQSTVILDKDRKQLKTLRRQLYRLFAPN